MPMPATRTDNYTLFPSVGTDTASKGTADIYLMGSLSSFANQ